MVCVAFVRFDEEEYDLQPLEIPLLSVPSHRFQGNKRGSRFTAGILAGASEPVDEQQPPIEAPKDGKPPIEVAPQEQVLAFGLLIQCP